MSLTSMPEPRTEKSTSGGLSYMPVLPTGTGSVWSFPSGLASLTVATTVAVCCVVPLAWLVWQVVEYPAALRGLVYDTFQWRLLGRTLLYNGTVAVVATLIALAAGVVLGGGRGKLAAVLWFALPV